MEIMQEIKVIVERHKIELIQKYGQERVAEILSKEFNKLVYGDPEYSEEPAGILAQVDEAMQEQMQEQMQPFKKITRKFLNDHHIKAIENRNRIENERMKQAQEITRREAFGQTNNF